MNFYEFADGCFIAMIVAIGRLIKFCVRISGSHKNQLQVIPLVPGVLLLAVLSFARPTFRAVDLDLVVSLLFRLLTIVS